MYTHARDYDVSIDNLPKGVDSGFLKGLEQSYSELQSNFFQSRLDDDGDVSIRHELAGLGLDLQLKLRSFLEYYCTQSGPVGEIVSANKKDHALIESFLNGKAVFESKADKDVVLNFLTFVRKHSTNSLLKLTLDQLQQVLLSSLFSYFNS